MKTLIGIAVDVLLVIVLVDALVLLAGWLIGPLGVHGLAALLAFGMRAFIWLLPFTALVMFISLMVDATYAPPAK